MDWSQTLVGPDQSLREVLAIIDKAELQIALVVDEQLRLLGLITDGDVRRALLRGADLQTLARDIMVKNPIVVAPDMKSLAIAKLMQQKNIHHIPVVNEQGIVVRLAVHGKFVPKERLDNDVVLMVGGLGSRLGDLTRETPKPLLKIADKPLLEIILDSFLKQGFYRFHFAVNYKAERIESYFGDGSKWGAEFSYLREDKRLGTCGALSLLTESPQKPFIVMNGDLLTKVNFKQLLDFHRQQKSVATMAVRGYDVQIPFGVIQVKDHDIMTICEKPTERFFVNAGIYVLNPECLAYIPYNQFFDMTQLFQKLLQEKQALKHFPIHDYWLDIGRASDFQQANQDFPAHWQEPSGLEP